MPKFVNSKIALLLLWTFMLSPLYSTHENRKLTRFIKLDTNVWAATFSIGLKAMGWDVIDAFSEDWTTISLVSSLTIESAAVWNVSADSCWSGNKRSSASWDMWCWVEDKNFEARFSESETWVSWAIIFNQVYCTLVDTDQCLVYWMSRCTMPGLYGLSRGSTMYNAIKYFDYKNYNVV